MLFFDVGTGAAVGADGLQMHSLTMKLVYFEQFMQGQKMPNSEALYFCGIWLSKSIQIRARGGGTGVLCILN